jgi:exopolysaccharide production protein ExoQ
VSSVVPLSLAPDGTKGERRGAVTVFVSDVCNFKVICALVLAVAFWFAVPYSLPLRISSDHAVAAAQEATAYQGSLSRELAVPVVLLVSGLMFWRLPRLGRITQTSKVTLAALCYMGWVLASIGWSGDRPLTAKRLVVFMICVAFVYALARTASVVEIALLGFGCAGAVAILSLLSDTLITRSFAPFDPNYRFMGVMTANFQAMNLVAWLLCALAIAQKRPSALRWLFPLFLLVVLLLFLTRARAGTFLCAAMFLVAAGLEAKQRLSARKCRLLTTSALGLSLVGILSACSRSGERLFLSVFMMGRNDAQNTASFSNRAPLWAELLRAVQQHPIAGFGYGAFWTSDRVRMISLHQGWTVPHAHNTYLDETLSLGLVGAFLYLCMVLGACWTAWHRALVRNDRSTLVPALFLTWLVLLSFSESIPLAPNLPTLIAYAFVAKMCLAENSGAADSTAIAGNSARPRGSGFLPRVPVPERQIG